MNNLVHSNNTLKKINLNLIISLLPIVVYSLIFFGFKALIIILSGLIFSILTDFIMNHKNFNLFNNFNLVSSLILTLMIPLNTPFYIVMVLSIINVILRNILKKFNLNIPVSLIIILIAYLVTSYKLPNTYDLKDIINLLIDAKTNVMAFNSPFLLIVSFVYLYIKDDLKYLMVLTTILTFILINYNLNINYLINGSFIFISIYMLADSMFSPMYRISQFIVGILNAIIASILISFKITNGILISTLLVCLVSPLIDTLYVKIKPSKK